MSDVFRFLSEIRGHLPPDAILVDEQSVSSYAANVTGFERHIAGVVRPTAVSQVQSVVRAAIGAGVTLYPFGCGRNWGFGSRLPVRSGAFLVDLSGMNRILEVNEEHGYAVVEPGVTQKQLADHLAALGSPWFLDVTGSGQHTSIIGNSLERGIAYNSLRAEKLSNLQVVLGSGELVSTGMGAHTEGPVAHLYRFGLGPQLDALFFQSSFGIVTRATIALSRRTENRTDFRIAFEDANLGPFFEAIRELKRDQIVTGIIRTGDFSRGFETMAPLLFEYFRDAGKPRTPAEIEAVYRKLNPEPWVSFGTLTGTPAMVRCKQRELRSRLRKVARVQFFTDRKVALARRVLRLLGNVEQLAMLEASQPLRQLVEGSPTDAAIKMVSWNAASGATRFSTEADSSAEGFLLVVPLAPLGGTAARRLADTTYEVAASHPVTPGVTLNAITPELIEGVISLKYRREPAGVAGAEACARKLYQRFAAYGYLPYRLNVNNMADFVGDSGFWRTVSLLKSVLDPSRVLSPARYEPVAGDVTAPGSAPS